MNSEQQDFRTVLAWSASADHIIEISIHGDQVDLSGMCPITNKLWALKDLSMAKLAAWQRDTKIQDAFPDMPEDQRELLITGTTNECWELMFGEDE